MKAIKTLLIVLVVIVVVVVGGVGIVVSTVDPNDYKEQISAQVREATGRELQLDGPLELALWPKISLKAGPVSLSNAEGFGDEPFFAADNIQVAVATLPLLSSRVEMDKVILHGLAINLARNAAGGTNWDDLAGGEPAEEEHGGGGLAAFVLGGVDIKDARISFSDASTEQNVSLSNINVSTGPLTFGDPVAFNMSLTAQSNQPALDSDMTLNATLSYNLDDEHYVISPLAFNALMRGAHLPGGKASIDFGAAIDVNLEKQTATISNLALTGLGTSVAGAFDARDIESDKPSANGELTITGADLASIFNAFQLPVGKQLGGISDRSFNFAVAFDADMDSGNVVVSKLDGNLLGAKLGGSFNATDANTDKPSAKGNLSASGPDLPTLLAVVGQLQGADAETLKSLNQALAGARDKSFSVAADLDANLAEGKASVPVLEVHVLGNTITGQMNATNADSDKPTVNAALKAVGPDFPTLLTVIAQMQGADAAALKGLTAALKGTKDRSFTVNADVNADMAKGTASVPKLDVQLLGNSITGTLQATNIESDKPAAKGSLKASGPDLAALLAIASQLQGDGEGLRDLAAGLAKEKNKSFKLELGFDTDMNDGRIDVETLSADLMGLEIRGGLKGQGVDFEKGKGSLDGNIAVVSKDLGILLRSAGQADLAKSVKSFELGAGIKGSLSDLTVTPLTLTAMVKGPGAKKPVSLKVSAAEARANLDKDTLTLKGLSVAGLGLNAKANLDAKNISKEPTFSGNLDVPVFNLRKLLASLNQPVPKTSDRKALTKVGLSSDFGGSNTSFNLDNLKIGLDGTKLTGNVNVANFTGPDLKFNIDIDRIDADRYMEPAPKGKVKAASPEAAAAGAAAELPVETLRALKIKGDLTIEELVLSGATMNKIKFSINANGGLIRLKPIGAELYDGTYSGNIVLDARGKKTKLKLKTALDKVNVGDLTMATVGNDMLAGIVAFDAALTGTGGDAERIKRTLNGKGKFSTVNGVFRGVDAVKVLQAVEQILECKCPVPIPKGGETNFTKLGGSITAKNGVISNRDLLLAGDGFEIKGSGTLANLRNNTLKYNLELAVTEQAKEAGGAKYNLGGYSVPIRCRGNIENPTCLPDLGKIVKAVIGNAAKDKVKKAVGDKVKGAIGGDTGEAIKNLLKF